MRLIPLARRTALAAAAVAAAGLLGGCGPATDPVAAAAGPTGSATSSVASASPGPSTSPSTTAPSTPPSTPPPPPPPPPQLPLGGRTILPTYRVVAFYGGPDGPALGVLGNSDPDTVAAQIEQRAAAFSAYGRPVQPAMELIATVASPCSSAAPLCTRAVPPAAIQRYLDAAHRHHMVLILDFQPGRGEFLPQVQADEQFLLDPSVSVALDPEWKLLANQAPMQVIGASSAASINAVSSYVSGLVQRANLPDKLLVVHEFRTSMLPDRQNIAVVPGLENVIHADGFGTQGDKLATWNALAIPNPPFFSGFKLFLTQDTAMFSPAQAMALSPQPDLITYQ